MDNVVECPLGHKFLDDPSYSNLPDDVPRCPICALEKDAQQNPYTFRLKQVIEDFKLLDAGCHSHPYYRARFAPRCACYRCAKMYEARERIKRMGFISQIRKYKNPKGGQIAKEN